MANLELVWDPDEEITARWCGLCQGSKVAKCLECMGEGLLTLPPRGLGDYRAVTCPKCRGNPRPCGRCRGTGKEVADGSGVRRTVK